jgi:predicted nucleic acid-binding protein
MTQAAFVRIVSNPAFSRNAVSPRDALVVLGRALEHPSHRFWIEDISVSKALAQFGRRLLGHQQVTDAYLLGLAIHKKGKFVTFDHSMTSLLAEESAAGGRLALL